MARAEAHTSQSSSGSSIVPIALAALVGLGFAAASAWVHYRLLRDPLYSSVCDINNTFSCTVAYTSRYGSVSGVSVALLGVLYFAFVLLLVALCRQSRSARENLPGYVFATSTVGLAGVLYLGYASFFILKTVCVLCLGTYAAILALFLMSGRAARFPMSSLPQRAARDASTLMRTPAALAVALAFVAVAAGAVSWFPTDTVAAAEVAAPVDPGAPALEQAAQQPAAPAAIAPEMLQQLEDFLSKEARVSIPVGGGGAAVVIVKFNDYQCPPCGLTFREYKPVLARLQLKHPGKIAFVTKDFPLDPECNSAAPGGGHQAACEAAVSVRLAREHGQADAMENWLFANQATLTPDSVRSGAASVGKVNDFQARYAATLDLVKADIAQGVGLAVRGTPTFFMNGIRMPNLRGEFFEAAVEWELRRLTAGK